MKWWASFECKHQREAYFSFDFSCVSDITERICPGYTAIGWETCRQYQVGPVFPNKAILDHLITGHLHSMWMSPTKSSKATYLPTQVTNNSFSLCASMLLWLFAMQHYQPLDNCCCVFTYINLSFQLDCKLLEGRNTRSSQCYSQSLTLILK